MLAYVQSLSLTLNHASDIELSPALLCLLFLETSVLQQSTGARQRPEDHPRTHPEVIDRYLNRTPAGDVDPQGHHRATGAAVELLRLAVLPHIKPDFIHQLGWSYQAAAGPRNLAAHEPRGLREQEVDSILLGNAVHDRFAGEIRAVVRRAGHRYLPEIKDPFFEEPEGWSADEIQAEEAWLAEMDEAKRREKEEEGRQPKGGKPAKKNKKKA